MSGEAEAIDVVNNDLSGANIVMPSEEKLLFADRIPLRLGRYHQ